MNNSAKGYTHVYYGYGKGKTTAAFGLALRAASYGRKVVIVQFLKNKDSGEVLCIEGIPNITVFRGQSTNKFSISMNDSEKHCASLIHNSNLAQAVMLVNKDECDMLILDEIIDAYQLNLIDKELFENFIINKPEFLELVITGHNPIKWLIDRADYVSEMVKRKHPYDEGVMARAGIEY